MNALQMCFHPIYAPEGQITVEGFLELSHSNKDIMIIADKNIISPICEIASKGFLSDKLRMQKIAMFVTWSKYLRSRVTSGIGLLENDTAGLSSVTGDESRLQFLHGIERIPPQIWKNIAFGIIDEVPSYYLYKPYTHNKKEYVLHDDYLFLSTEAAIIHLVKLARCSTQNSIDTFISFMNWYADHLEIAESIIVYAALVFSRSPNIALPKNINSNNYERVVKGIRNQAWDITYIAIWSMHYYNEPSQQCTFFATDDNTQKRIIVNTIPQGQYGSTLRTIFHTKTEEKKLNSLFEAKFGRARKKPYQDFSEVEKITAIKKLIASEYDELKAMLKKYAIENEKVDTCATLI